ncbi:hypothetical protein JW960_03790 [candidate division KSB1 bacterium]|nr:hypothetical protein [candidate division KSB1 bacterium]
MTKNQRSIMPGIILILIGAYLLLNQLDVINIYWSDVYPVVILVIGLSLVILSIRKQNHGAIFWGTIFTLIGVMFGLRNFGIMPYYYMDELWPAFLLIIGFAFVMLFVVNPRDWGVLIPGGILLFLGMIFLFRNLELYWARDILVTYWPLVLILIGGLIIWDSFQKKSKQELENK